MQERAVGEGTGGYSSRFSSRPTLDTPEERVDVG